MASAMIIRARAVSASTSHAVPRLLMLPIILIIAKCAQKPLSYRRAMIILFADAER